MANTIRIKKEKIPYKTKVKFSNGIFKLGFRYNSTADRLLVDLYTEDGELIQDSERMMQEQPLWWIMLEDIQGNHNPIYPDAYLIPVSDDGTEKEVNLENINSSIFLKIQQRGTAEVEFDYILD